MKIKIDRDWLFYPSAGCFDMLPPEFDDNYWRKLDLPHDWAIENDFEKKNYLPSVLLEGHLEARDDSFLPRGEGLYRKHLFLPPEAQGQRIFLEFDGVFGESVLYVDGKKAGENTSGYTGKVYEITSFVSGKDSVVLALRVNANRMQGWWYEGAGIYRHVHLITAPRCCIPEWGVGVTTSEISGDRAKVCVSVEIDNALEKSCSAVLELKISDPDGICVTCDSKTFSAAPGKCEEISFAVDIDDVKLWDIDKPRLYRAGVILKTAAGCQEKKTNFGIRSFCFTPDHGFFLNGRHLQLRGGNLHHDYGALGTALPDRAHEKNVETAKEMGVNILRSSHNPAAPALMDACDRLGMLFWAETRNLHPEEGGNSDLRALIRRDRNHPSVICWSLANTAGAKDGKTCLTENLQQLHDLAKTLDPQRPTAVGLEGNADFNANGFACVTDLVGYNGGGMKKDVPDHAKFPERCIAISEYSSGRGARGVYEKSVLGEVSTETLGDGRTVFRDGKRSTEQELLASHAAEWSHIARHPFLAGGLMWSLFEYRGETSGFPIVTSQFGVFDICRFPKDAYFFYRMMWRDEPLVHVFPPWNFKVPEGEEVELYCLSNCQELELQLDGRCLWKGQVGFDPENPEPFLKLRLPYKPGTLTASGFNDGKKVFQKTWTTPGKAARLRILPDRTELSADGEDVSFIRLDVLDAEGNFVPDGAVKLNIRVEGAGFLRGVCSGDPAGHENEKSDSITTFSGSALVVVQTGREAGDITLAVTSDELETARTVLHAVS